LTCSPPPSPETGAENSAARCTHFSNPRLPDASRQWRSGTAVLSHRGQILPGKYGNEDNRYKAEQSLKSFLFTLKNPHNFPARRFALKAEKKDRAIFCDYDYGPHFCDIDVSDNCNANINSLSRFFGGRYTNDTELDGNMFFTGSFYFQVKEIEVFEISN
jgi:hypothetical protein